MPSTTVDRGRVDPDRADAFLLALLRVLPDPVFSVDERGAVLSANDAAERLLATAGDAERAAPLWTLFRTLPLGEPVATTSPDAEVSIEAEWRDRDGNRSWWQLRVTPVTAGESRSWAVVARDFTDLHRLQAQLAKQASALEAQESAMAAQQDELRLRTEAAERAQNVAEQARAEADAANAAKSQFLATMSHELRTPLNAIVGYAELLSMELSGPLNDAQRSYLARLATSSGHLLGLISDILDLTKIDAGGMIVRAERESTTAVIESALAVAAAQAGQRGIALTVGANPDVPFVGDADRVRQVLLNFLSNAMKFTERGGLVTVSSGSVDSAPAEARLTGHGPWGYIRVADTGIGIEPEMQATVFDPFVQVAGGKTRAAGGTGLGLAISRRLARLMGGDLTLESEPGEGSTFTLWLPSLRSSAADPIVETPADRVARARRSSSEHRAHGLGDLGMALREDLEAVIESYVARMRADAEFLAVRRMAQPLLEDHVVAFLADLAQTLVSAEHAAHLDPLNPIDSAEILRVIAELHGQQRRRLGWTEAQLVRGYTLLVEEMTTRLRRYDAPGSADVNLALGILRGMVAKARAYSVAAFKSGEQPGH